MAYQQCPTECLSFVNVRSRRVEWTHLLMCGCSAFRPWRQDRLGRWPLRRSTGAAQVIAGQQGPSLDLFEDDYMHRTRRLDFDQRGIRGGWSPSGLNWAAFVGRRTGRLLPTRLGAPPNGSSDRRKDAGRTSRNAGVTDQVMQRDRRAWWMRHWLPRTTCIQTREVFERHEPVLFVSHAADDGIWQLIGASDADADTDKIGHLHHAVDEDPSLIDVLDLPPGSSALRADIGSPWNTSV
jgi:hypothetical protein